MTHEELLTSEWIEEDAMTVRLVLDVRVSGTCYPVACDTPEQETPKVVIPESDLGTRFLTMLEVG
jgi:hypothetical protein